MKNLKRFILALLLFFFIFSPTIVLAEANLIQAREDEATQGAGTGIRQTIKEEVQEKIATVQARLSERKKEIIRNHFSRVVRRLGAVFNCFYLLIGRIES